MGSSSTNLSHRKEKSRVQPLTELPMPHRAIIEALITPRELSYDAICTSITTQHTHTRSEVDNALFELVQQAYLSSFFENGEVYYYLEYDLDTKPDKHDEINRPSNPLDDILDNT